MQTLEEIIRKEFFQRNRWHPRTWIDWFPYDNAWHDPKPQRGRPYDGAIINEDGKLIIPKQS